MGAGVIDGGDVAARSNSAVALGAGNERDCEGVDLERGCSRQQRVSDAVVKAMAGRADAEVAQRGQDSTSTTAGA
jgi:hypothetical protein